MITIGEYSVQMIDAGRFRLDGGAMFGVVPKALWGRQKPADERNRIFMSTNLLLLRSESKTILIDTGNGDKFDDKFAQIYAVDQQEHSLEKGLARAGLTKNDITDVILTHLHFDHAGGATVKDPVTEELLPTFPNAHYYVQKRHWDWALAPSEKDQASFIPENFRPLKKAGQLTLIDGETDLFPGIRLLPIDGHTIAQQMVLIESDQNVLLHAADLLPTAAHLATPWVMAYDLNPLTTIEEKKRYVSLALEKGWLLFFEHDPELHCARVKMGVKGIELGESVDLR